MIENMGLIKEPGLGQSLPPPSQQRSTQGHSAAPQLRRRRHESRLQLKDSEFAISLTHDNMCYPRSKYGQIMV